MIQQLVKKTATLLSERSICKIPRRFNPERLEQFAEIGINKALHQIAGYQVQQVAIDPQLKFKAIVHNSLLIFDESDPRYQAAIDKLFDESDLSFVEAVDKMTDMLVCTLYGELAEQLEKHLDECGNPLDFYNWKQAKIDAEYIAKKFLREGRQAYSAKINQALPQSTLGFLDPSGQKFINQVLARSLDDLGIEIPS